MSGLDAEVAARLGAWTEERVAERLWARDGSLWAASGKAPEEVAAWLGWLAEVHMADRHDDTVPRGEPARA